MITKAMEIQMNLTPDQFDALKAVAHFALGDLIPASFDGEPIQESECRDIYMLGLYEIRRDRLIGLTSLGYEVVYESGWMGQYCDYADLLTSRINFEASELFKNEAALQEMDQLDSEMGLIYNKPASASETLMHMIYCWLQFGRTSLIVWRTPSGKYVPETALLELEARGLIRYIPPTHPDMYAVGNYCLNI